MFVLGAQQGFGHTQEVDHLGDSEERSNHNHSAETTAEECCGSFIFKSFAVNL